MTTLRRSRAGRRSPSLTSSGGMHPHGPSRRPIDQAHRRLTLCLLLRPERSGLRRAAPGPDPFQWWPDAGAKALEALVDEVDEVTAGVDMHVEGRLVDGRGGLGRQLDLEVAVGVDAAL